MVLCGESEESLRGLVERFGRVCKRKSLKVNVDKSKVMVEVRTDLSVKLC